LVRRALEVVGYPDEVSSQKMLKGADVSAQTPSIGFNFGILRPIVLTIRQPPLKVPNPIAAFALRTTDGSILNSRTNPPTKTP